MTQITHFHIFSNKHILRTLFLLLAFCSLSNQAFGKTLTAKGAVGSGKGTVTVEIYSKWWGFSPVTQTSTNGAQVSISYGDVSIANWGYSKYTATAATGYTFSAWYTNSSCSSGEQKSNPYSTGSTTGNREDKYWAKFTPNPYKVKFNANGGTGTMADQSFTYDVAQNLTANSFTKTGFTFAGWATSANGAVAYTNGQSVSNLTTTKNGTVNLYAKWTANTYYVAFNGNGSTSGSMGNQTFAYATAQNLTANAYVKVDVVNFDSNGGSCAATSVSKNAAFAGWATSSDGAKAYNDKQSVSNLTSTAGATVNLFAKWSQTNTITLPSATKSGCVLDGWSDGSSNVGDAGATYSVPLGGITLTAIWSDKYTPEFGGHDLALKVGETSANNVFTFNHTDNPSVHFSQEGIVSYDAESNTVTALQAGVTDIYFTQAETETIKSGESDHWTITVTRVDNTLALNSASATKYVDEEVTNVVNLGTKNSNANLQTSSSDATIAYYDIANNKIVIPNSEAKTFTSKTVTIKIWQAQNVQYTASGEKTFTLTVKKYANAVKVNGAANYSADVYYDDGLFVEFTSLNTNNPTAPYSVTPTSGEEYATYYDNDEGQYIWTAPTPGTARWTVAQEEDYKFLSASTTMTVHVIAAPAASDCYVLNSPAVQTLTTHSYSTGGVQGEAMELSGPGQTLTFQGKIDLLGVNQNVWGTEFYNYVEYSSDGVRWDDLSYMFLPTSYKDYSFDISNLDVKFIRFEAKVGSTLSKYFRNVRVTRKTYLTPSVNSLTVEKNGDNFIYPDETASAQLTIDWSCANGGDLKITTNNDKFRVSQDKITNVDCNSGSTTITVYYDAASAEDETGKLFINNSVYSATVDLIGKARRHSQTISWKQDVEIMQEGDEVTNAATAMTDVTYVSSNPSVISVSLDGKTLTAVSNGTATITANAVASGIYEAATSDKLFTVTDEQIQYIIWNQSFVGLHVDDENIVLNAVATSNVEGCTTEGIRPITYTSNDESVVKIVNGNELQIVGVGNTIVTATQAGGVDDDGHNYIAVSKENKVIVTELSGDCEAYIPLAQTSYTLFDMNTNLPQLQFDLELNPAVNGQPASVSFDCKTESFAGLFRSGDLILAQKLNGEWVDVRNFGLPTEGEYDSYTDIPLDRNATAIRFYRPQGGTGYHDIANVSVKLRRYIETSSESYTVTTKVGETRELSIIVNYSNTTAPIIFSLSGASTFSLDKDNLATSCGDKGTVTVNVTYTPTAETAGEDVELTISDGETTRTITITGVAELTSRSIQWTPAPVSSLYTVETYSLNAICKTEYDLPGGDVLFRLNASSTTGTLNGNELSFDRYGYADIEAYVEDNARYNSPVETAQIQVLLTPTTVVTAPSVSSVRQYDEATSVQLTDWAVENTITHQPVSGTMTVVSPSSFNTLGLQSVTLHFEPEDGNMYEECDYVMNITVDSPVRVFEGNGNWDDAANWKLNNLPEYNDDVKVTGQLTISDSHTVNNLTIAGEGSVTMVANGELTINGKSENSANYGDLFVKNGGSVVMAASSYLKVKDLIIEARLGNVEHPGSSGQISSKELVNVNGDVYFKLSLEPDGSRATLGWYDFVVPFEVDVIGGITIADAPTTPMVFNSNYAVMAYDESKRAANGKAWNKFTGTLVPGKVYTIAIDDAYDWTTVLFKKKQGASINPNTSLSTSYSNVGNEGDRGWNGLGNGTLQHCQLNLNAISATPKIQVYDHKNDNYITLDAPSYTCAIGTSFFVQVPNTAPVVSLSAASQQNRGGGGKFFAPAREDKTITEFCLALTMDGDEIVSDRLWVSANEAATGEYVIGQDLAKLGELKSSKIARMWAKNKDMNLCDIEMPLVYGQASCELNMYAPKQATYTLAVEEAPEDAELFLTYNGKVIWNLTSSPAEIVLNPGMKTDFGLILKSHNASEIAEGVDNIDQDNHSVRKVLIDNIIYVITPDGAMYDVNGKLIR